MKKLTLLLPLVLLLGCDGTQAGAAFTPRPPAPYISHNSPNVSQQHNANLLTALDKATQKQDHEQKWFSQADYRTCLEIYRNCMRVCSHIDSDCIDKCETDQYYCAQYESGEIGDPFINP